MVIPSRVEVEEYSRRVFADQSIFVRDHYHLPDFACTLAFTDRRTAHSKALRSLRKGQLVYQVKLNLYNILRFPLLGIVEYASFNDRPRVGGFRSNDWRRYIDCLIAHELSHVVVYMLEYASEDHPLRYPNNDYLIFNDIGVWDAGHGDFFQSIYFTIREKFLNPFIDLGNPPECGFNGDGDFERRLAKMPSCPYTGIEFTIKGKTLTVIGYNPNNRRLYRYQTVDQEGNYFAVMLRTIINHSPKAAAMCRADGKLSQELYEHMVAVDKQALTNRKIRESKFRTTRGG